MSDLPNIGVLGAHDVGSELYEQIIECSGGRFVSVPHAVEFPLETLNGLVLTDGLIEQGSGTDQDIKILVNGALDRDIPLLGVGGGMQFINTLFGGDKPTEINGHGIHIENDEHKSSYHRIYIAPGSKLAAIVGAGGFVRVNSRHALGLREKHKAPRLLASAYGLEDGVIEALESPRHDWVIGVQFNPERAKEIPPHFNRLFQGLIQRADR